MTGVNIQVEIALHGHSKNDNCYQKIQSNPRKQFMHEIRKELKIVIDSSVNVIVGEDFNETLTSTEGMMDIFEDLGLYNVFKERLRTNALPRTYSSGKAAVDHIWTSKYVLDNIVRAGIASFGYLY